MKETRISGYSSGAIDECDFWLGINKIVLEIFKNNIAFAFQKGAIGLYCFLFCTFTLFVYVSFFIKKSIGFQLCI
jgi:hypothetical protein